MLEAVHDLRRLVLLWLFLISIFLFAMALGMTTIDDYRSCNRSVPVRDVQRHNAALIRRSYLQDAARADAYADIDPNPNGRAVNRRFAAQRRQLARSVQPAPPINCGSFPAGT